MKKFITGLFFSLVFIVFLIMLFSVPKNSFFRDKAGAYWSGGSTITFDDIDYTFNLPYNTSLNYLQDANLIKDSTLSKVEDTDTGNHQWSYTGSIHYDNNSFLIDVRPDGNYNYYLVYDLDTSLYRGSTLCFGLSVNGVEYYSNFYVNDSGTGSSVTGTYWLGGSQYMGLSLRIYIYSDSRMGLTLDVRPNAKIPYIIDYAFCYLDEKLPYFSTDYIDNLLKAEDIYNSDYSWSTSPVMSVSYDFDTFTPDTTLYYIKDIPVFNISNTLPNYLSKLSSVPTLTEDVLMRLKNSYNSLSTSFPSSSDLQIENLLDVFKAIFNVLVSTFKVLFYSTSVTSYTGLLAFAPILDLFSYIGIVIYSSFSSWFTL